MKKGFALLLSLIVTSILLTVGIGVSAVAFREIQLSSFGNQSEIAFYAAETGLECGMYWDKVVINSSKLTDADPDNDEGSDVISAFVDGSDYTSLISCLGDNISPLPMIYLLDDTANFKLNLSTGPCVNVDVKKEESTGHSGSLAWAKTIITATGYNTCDDTDPRRVGRVLELELNLAP